MAFFAFLANGFLCDVAAQDLPLVLSSSLNQSDEERSLRLCQMYRSLNIDLQYYRAEYGALFHGELQKKIQKDINEVKYYYLLGLSESFLFVSFLYTFFWVLSKPNKLRDGLLQVKASLADLEDYVVSMSPFRGSKVYRVLVASFSRVLFGLFFLSFYYLFTLLALPIARLIATGFLKTC